MSVKGDVEKLVEADFVAVLGAYSDLASITTNMRAAKSASTARVKPGIYVDCMAEQSVPRTNEYAFRVEIGAETQLDADKAGTALQAMIGAVRDALHQDKDSGGFTGDCEGFLEDLNARSTELVYHQVHEVDTYADDDGRTRRMVMNVMAWGYPGKVSA